MSSTTVLGVMPDRRPVEIAVLRNGSGWAPSIWGRLLESRGESVHWMSAPAGLYRLWEDVESVPEWQQVPLLLTFGTGVVPAGAFADAALALDEFERRLPSPPGHANHVPAVADLFRKAPEVPEVPFIGVHGTSISENPFDPWGGPDGEVPGDGIPLADMYVLERHRHLLEVTT